MVINALNSGAKVLHGRLRGFDLRRPGPTCSTGQRALREAVAGTLDWMAPDGSKHYVLKPTENRPC